MEEVVEPDDWERVPDWAKLFPASLAESVVITLGGTGGLELDGAGGRLILEGVVFVAATVAVRIADTIACDGSGKPVLLLITKPGGGVR